MKAIVPTLLFVSVLATSVDAANEPTPPPRAGDHVRVSLLADSTIVVQGRLLAWDASTLGVRLDEGKAGPDSVAARRLSRDAIAGLEVGKSHGHPVRGAFLGALLFPLFWAGAIALGDPQGDEGLAYLGPVFLGPILGVLLGAGIGGSIRHEEWRPAPLPMAADSTGSAR
jgi:hypothetical protein